MCQKYCPLSSKREQVHEIICRRTRLLHKVQPGDVINIRKITWEIYTYIKKSKEIAVIVKILNQIQNWSIGRQEVLNILMSSRRRPLCHVAFLYHSNYYFYFLCNIICILHVYNILYNIFMVNCIIHRVNFFKPYYTIRLQQIQ